MTQAASSCNAFAIATFSSLVLGATYALSGRPTLVGKALSFTHELSFFLSFFVFLSIHRAQQLQSGWPSNVFWRFGRK